MLLFLKEKNYKLHATILQSVIQLSLLQPIQNMKANQSTRLSHLCVALHRKARPCRHVARSRSTAGSSGQLPPWTQLLFFDMKRKWAVGPRNAWHPDWSTSSSRAVRTTEKSSRLKSTNVTQFSDAAATVFAARSRGFKWLSWTLSQAGCNTIQS